MTIYNEKIAAARAALCEAQRTHAGRLATYDEAEKTHERATVVLGEAQSALNAIAARDADRDASVAARLADAIRSGKPIAIDNDADGHVERAEAERRRSIAQQAAETLHADVTAAALTLQDARNGVDAAAKAVLIAERDALTAKLQEWTAAFLDARHRLMGLLDSRLVPSTPTAVAAVGELDRAYPPGLHPSVAAVRSWTALSKSLVDDHNAAYMPSQPVLPPDPLAPMREHFAAQRKAEEAERAAVLALKEETASSATQLFVAAERMHEFAARAAGG